MTELQQNLFGDIFRPKKREHLIGKTQLACWDALTKSFEEGVIKNKILFIGDTGLGKTTIAEMYIKLLYGLSPDDDISDVVIHRFNGGSQTGIDIYRDSMLNALDRRPLGQKYKIFFIDEIHSLSKPAQRALLTPLEDLPDWAVVIVATNEPGKLVDALEQGRWRRFVLQSPTKDDFKKLAAKILSSIKFQGTITESDIDDLYESAKGSIRNFVELLQSFVEGTYVKIATEEDNEFAKELISGYKQGDLVAKIKLAFRDAEKAAQGNYKSLAIGLAHYSIALISGKTTGGWFTNACALLETFGDGLSPYGVSEKAAFYVALKRYMEFRK